MHLQLNITFICMLLACMKITTSIDSKMKQEMWKSARAQGIDPDNLKPGQVFYTPPDLSDEEEGSQFMPKAHRCDGCIAVAYQFQNHIFPNAEKIKRKGEKLKDSEVIDATEHLCNKGFVKDYGLKNVNGKNVLSGEGLESVNSPGMMEAGGKWRARLQHLCKELIEKYEEDGIYHHYYNRGDKKMASTLCVNYCKGAEKRKLKDEL